MTRLRAVPSAVWTAVAALAFLASTGLAVVLGVGLHVWSGPAARAADVAAHALRGAGSGLVTVPGSAARTVHPVTPTSPATRGQSPAAPVIVPAAPRAAAPHPPGATSAPAVSPPAAQSPGAPGRPGHGLGAAVFLRSELSTLFHTLTALDQQSGAGLRTRDGSLRVATRFGHDAVDAQTGDSRDGRDVAGRSGRSHPRHDRHQDGAEHRGAGHHDARHHGHHGHHDARHHGHRHAGHHGRAHAARPQVARPHGDRHGRGHGRGAGRAAVGGRGYAGA